jgi:hypothetical protein
MTVDELHHNRGWYTHAGRPAGLGSFFGSVILSRFSRESPMFKPSRGFARFVISHMRVAQHIWLRQAGTLVVSGMNDAHSRVVLRCHLGAKIQFPYQP